MSAPTFSHVNSPRGAVQGLNFVWDIPLLEWVPMQQPILNAGTVTASFVGTGLALDSSILQLISNTSRYTLEFDYAATTNPVYFGKAAAGTAISAAGWQIAKFTYDGSGNILTMTYAGGSTAFTNIWNNRASYSYF